LKGLYLLYECTCEQREPGSRLDQTQTMQWDDDVELLASLTYSHSTLRRLSGDDNGPGDSAEDFASGSPPFFDTQYTNDHQSFPSTRSR